jgi:hypothetical protein
MRIDAATVAATDHSFTFAALGALTVSVASVDPADCRLQRSDPDLSRRICPDIHLSGVCGVSVVVK